MRRIYLDNTATTPLAPEAFDAMKPFLTEKFGNPSSIHSFGRETRSAIDESREQIAGLMGTKPGEIYFVSCGTEANNFALKGYSSKMRERGKDHIITSKTEHHSILETCEHLENNGFQISYLNVDEFGMIDPDDVRRSINSRTGLISIMHANNETGTINRIKAVSGIARDSGVIFHTDAVQSFGKIPVDVDELGVDMLSISAHKFYGPKGIGVLYISSGIEIERLLHGGGQERGKRAGTENIAYAVGLAKAAELICGERASENKRISDLKNQMIKILKEQFPFILFNGNPAESLPNVVNISFDSRKINIDGEALLMNLDLAGIAVSSGSACTSGSIKPSHVLIAMGRDIDTAKASIRFSLGRSTTMDDIEYTMDVLQNIVKRIGVIKG
jgi:cysteine desulfurase